MAADHCLSCGRRRAAPDHYSERLAELEQTAAQTYERTGRREWRGLDAGDDLRDYLLHGPAKP